MIDQRTGLRTDASTLAQCTILVPLVVVIRRVIAGKMIAAAQEIYNMYTNRVQ